MAALYDRTQRGGLVSQSGVGVRACVFDAYGTVFDHGSAALRHTAELKEKTEPLTRLWRQKQVEYTWLRGLQQRHADFWQVTADALDFAMESVGIEDGGLREELLQTYLRLEAFADVLPAIQQIRARGMRTAILSNGTPEMLAAAVGSAGLAGEFEAVISVEEAGVFKPHPRVYELALERLGLERGEILFLSSNGWDAYAASAFGMRVGWCNRYGQVAERLPGKPEYEIRTLAELPGLLGAR
jgi:2-haloacid dehalogenase